MFILPSDFENVLKKLEPIYKQPFRISFSSLTDRSLERTCHTTAVKLPNCEQPYVFVEGTNISFSADRCFLSILEHCKLWTSPKGTYRAIEGFSLDYANIKIVFCGSAADGGLLFISGEQIEQIARSNFEVFTHVVLGSWTDSFDLHLAQSALMFRRVCGSTAVEDVRSRVSQLFKQMIS